MKTEKQILNIKLMGKQPTKMLNQEGRKERSTERRKGGREQGRVEEEIGEEEHY
jgi:hypothetical protein